MNKLVLPVVIVLVAVVALASSAIGIDGLASIGIERFTAKQFEDGTVRSTIDVDVAQKLGSFANLIVGLLFTMFAWVKGWVNAIAQLIADLTADKPKTRTVVNDDGSDEDIEELPQDRKDLLEQMLIDAVYARDRKRTILWCHELSGSDYLTAARTEPATETQA